MKTYEENLVEDEYFHQIKLKLQYNIIINSSPYKSPINVAFSWVAAVARKTILKVDNIDICQKK